MHTTSRGRPLARAPHISDARGVSYGLAYEFGLLSGTLRTAVPCLSGEDRGFLDDAHRIISSGEVRQPHNALARIVAIAARSPFPHHHAAPAQIIRAATRRLVRAEGALSVWTVSDAEADTNTVADKAVMRWHADPTPENARVAIDALHRQAAYSEALAEIIEQAGPGNEQGRASGNAGPWACTSTRPSIYADDSLGAIAYHRLAAFGNEDAQRAQLGADPKSAA